MNTVRERRAGGRSGFTAFELMTAGVVLTVLMTICGTLIVTVTQLSQETHARFLALQEVANLLDQIVHHEDSKTESSFENRKPSQAILYRWPDAFYAIETSEDELGKRATVSLRFSPELDVLPITLTGWFNAPKGDAQ